MQEPNKTEVIVVGAGPSGLATAACLTRNSIPYILIEREDCIASLWKKKSYERLHLHLPKHVCQFPHVPFPDHFPKYVPRADFIRYMDDYALHFRISPLFNRLVTLARYDDGVGRWHVKATNKNNDEEEEYVGRFLVVATGETSDPLVPEVEGLESFTGKVIHSTQYKTGEEFTGKRVMVVGAGNSGMEIALDLSNYGAHTSIVIRSPIHIMKRWMMNLGVNLVKYFSVQVVDRILMILSKFVYGDLAKHGITTPKVMGPYITKAKYGKFPVIDVGTAAKIKAGHIQVLSAIRSVRGNKVTLENGKSYPFDAIIFATGFCRSTNKWLQGDEYLLNEDGFSKASFPNQWKGKRGLYCAGLSRRGLYGAAMDAQYIADDIKSLLQNY